MPHPFDDFSKSLNESVPRRESLRRLGAVFAAAVLSPLALGTESASASIEPRNWRRPRRLDPCQVFCQRCNNKKKQSQCLAACRKCNDDPRLLSKTGGKYYCCGEGQTYCRGQCVDFKNDPRNCGGCGRACRNGKVCVNGRCRDSGGNQCPTGQTACGNSCVNLSSDVNNCGTCGNICATGQTCVNGTCIGGGTECDPGQSKCGDSCVYLFSDPNNCGACGNVCSGSTPNCEGGTCTGETPECPSGYTWCGGACIDVMWDSGNCGACGNVCPQQTACAFGVCEGLCIGCG